MDMNQYLDMFIDEAREHLQAINDNLLVFEKTPEDISIVNEIFRSAHTLKGMAATMGFEDLAALTHEMENVLDLIRQHKLVVTTPVIDVIFQSVDALESMVTSIIEKGDGKLDVTDIVAKLAAIVSGKYDPKEFETNSSAISIAKAEVAVATAVPVQTQELTGLELDDFELTVLSQSRESGYHIYHIQVVIRQECVLKAARAYMVFDLLDKSGEVIKSNPSVEEIEEEKFDTSFDLIYVSTESADHLQQVILRVSEIEEANVQQLELEFFQQSNPATEDTQPVVQTESTQVQPPPVANATVEQTVQNEATSDADQSNAASRNVNKTIRVSIDRLDVLMNLFSELVIDRGRLEQISRDLHNNELQETVEHMSRISGDLQGLILNMRMVPIEQVFNRFPRMIRSLAKELNKSVDLQISGAETELDRTVIDEIGDPLVHLLRNALDHGLETAEERRKAGKPETGTIQLKALHSGNHVIIQIVDDGNGINREAVLKKALQNNIISLERGREMSDQEVYQLIFSSGFSTAEKISDISGRGVGLDVVKNKIESLGGSVSIESQLGKGTTFSIQLPLTLSIISAMLVEVEEENYAIPLTSIIETAVFKRSQILSAHRQKVIDFRGKVVPLVSIKEVFELEQENEEDEVVSVVIVRKGDKMAGLIVDSFIGQQEVVLKSLGKYLTNVFAISGATILGDGKVALIIDCNTLIK
ncbi:chemotaxis protein CheA [Bacillus horti]|uniref:Chemotaxis protein CheA n=1 Tax=Caldalkalibacillus horti TaxID=77523 RepID=A0ABT9VUN7_9BACI|nr:chemotaxis protein CheA [Bacillus horti]MDQ0164684.1 two-component system chemotaxis sensor kinase CheA [Bacillus horti]